MAHTIPRYRVIPEPNHTVSFECDGVERLKWHFGAEYQRPFFYPLLGPSGATLTRIGHPGAPNHDHHRSIWFAHHDVTGVDFWSNTSPARIEQASWLAYDDSDEHAAMAVQLKWVDGHDPAPLLQQELIAVLKVNEKNESLLELQSTFKPTSSVLELGKTNFGFLAVRVARDVSAYFGGGTITSSDGSVDERNIFGKAFDWVDYSGNVRGSDGKQITEGVTYFDHPDNVNHPSKWHVREDGWMGASVCYDAPLLLKKEKPLTLRYQLHAHGGALDRASAKTIADDFANSAGWSVAKAGVKHTQYKIVKSSTLGT